MTWATNRFTWTVQHDDRLMQAEIIKPVKEVVYRWCELRPKIFSDPEFSGEALGVLKVSVSVHHRDYWFTMRAARDLATALAVTSRIKVAEFRDPDPAKLPPHPFRGRRRFEAAKYQEPVS